MKKFNLTPLQRDVFDFIRRKRMTYWTFERDGEIFDAEFKTKREAYDLAQQLFSEECENDGIAHNETRSEEYFLIYFCHDYETGELVIDEREKSFLEYTGYHGDLAEHGTWHSGGGGVI